MKDKKREHGTATTVLRCYTTAQPLSCALCMAHVLSRWWSLAPTVLAARRCAVPTARAPWGAVMAASASAKRRKMATAASTGVLGGLNFKFSGAEINALTATIIRNHTQELNRWVGACVGARVLDVARDRACAPLRASHPDPCHGWRALKCARVPWPWTAGVPRVQDRARWGRALKCARVPWPWTAGVPRVQDRARWGRALKCARVPWPWTAGVPRVQDRARWGQLLRRHLHAPVKRRRRRRDPVVASDAPSADLCRQGGARLQQQSKASPPRGAEN